MKGVPIGELPIEAKRRLGLRTRKTEFSKEAVRTWAIRVLGDVADLTQDQRRRVLEHAIKLNKV